MKKIYLVVLLGLLMGPMMGWGQTYYAMSGGNYSQTFTNLSTAYPTNMNGLAVLATGSIPVATRTTTATNAALAVVTNAAAIGYDAISANSTKMIFLTTGGTDNSAAVACDLNLNFTGRTAGNLAFNYANILNTPTASPNGRASSLIVYYSINGTTWTSLGGPYTVYNNTGASTANVPVSITLPAALDNQATVKLRFYEYNGGAALGTPSGSRPKISLDDISVTSTPGCTAQTITALSTPVTKTYGDATYNVATTATSGLTVTYASSNTAVATVDASGNVTIVAPGSATITAAQAGNGTYCAATSVTQALTVNNKTLTISGLTANSKVFDGTTTATLSGTPTLEGVVGSDVITLGGTPVANFNDATVATGKPVTVTGYTISGTNAARYTLTQPAGLTADITNPATPTISASGNLTTVTTTYGTASGNTSFSVTGVSMSAGITITPPVGFQISTLADFSSNVGNNAAPITIGGAGTIAATTIYVRLAATAAVTGTYNSQNIVLSSSGATTVNITTTASGNTVTAKALTITGLLGVNKTYDATTTASFTGSAAYNGLVNGETFGTVSGSASATFVTKTVGVAKTVNITGYTAPSTNYSITNPTVTATISVATLTVSGATANNKSYDGTNTATITGATLVGVISPDDVTVSAGGTFASINVGTGIVVTPSLALAGADAGNYTLTQPTGLTANITAIAPTLTATTINLTVGGTYTLPGTNVSTNSGGALSYSITGGGFATLAGSIITGASVGTEVLTINQAASGNYTAGSTTVTVSVTAVAPCAPIWEENFDYGGTAAANLPPLSGGNWTRFSGTANDFSYANSSLSYSGYTSSGVGGSAYFAPGGVDDISRSFSSVTSGELYASFLINMDNTTSTSDDYFVALVDNSNSYHGRIYVQTVGSQFKLGISKQSSASSQSQTGLLNFGTPYLVVVKYQFVSGGTNDPFSLWVISGAVPISEGTAGVPISATTASTDAPNLSGFALRQTNKAKGYIDGIRVATTWADAVCTVVVPSNDYTWTGGASTTSWTDAANWSPSGVPTSSDNIIINTAPSFLLNVNSARVVNNFTLNGTGNFSMSASGNLTINGNVTYGGTATASLACGSTVNITNSSSQIIPPLNYGTLNATGGARVLPNATIGICGAFTRGSGAYTIGTGTVNFNGAGNQAIAAGNYYNLTVSNSRGGGSISLPSGTVDIANTFDVSSLASFSVVLNNNTINFSSASAQTIPGFFYYGITNTGNGPRTLGTLSEININFTFSLGSGAYSVDNSTVNYSNNGGGLVMASFTYHNLKFSGTSDFVIGTSKTVNVLGNFTQSNGIVYVNDASGTGTLAITGDATLSGGILDISFGSGIGLFSVGNDFFISGGILEVLDGTSATPNTTVTIGRDLNISSTGKISLENVSTAGGVATINVGRDFNSTGTSVAASGSNGVVDFGTGTVTSNAIVIGRNFNKSGAGTFGTTSGNNARGFVLTGGTPVTPATFTYAGGNSDYTSYEVASSAYVQMQTSLSLGTLSAPNSIFTTNGSLDFGANNIIGATTNPQFITATGTNLITSNSGGIGGTTATGSLRSFGSIGTTSASGRAMLATGINYTFNGATSAPFPATGTFGNPGDFTLGANVSLNRTTLASGTVSLNNFDLTLNASDLGFSTITGVGSIVGDNVADIIVAGVVGASCGTLRFKAGSQIIAQLIMNRAARTLTLGSAISFDGIQDPTNVGRLILTEGIVDASGQTINFINGNTPITRTNGTLSVSATSEMGFGSTGNISGTTFTLPANLFTSSPSIARLSLNRTNPLQLNAQGMELNTNLNLTLGTLRIGASLLSLNGASLTASGGFLEGSTTSDFTVSGTTGGMVTIPLPTSTNISLRTVSIAGTRTLAMDGINDMSLNGALSIATGATFDNGGESKISSGTIPSITINGTFITRDQQGFVGSNTVIPSITPVLNAGSTVEYGRAGNQDVQGSTAPTYSNITISGSGTKTLESTNPIDNGTITIKDAAIFDIGNKVFGSTQTNLTMSGTSRLVNGGSSIKPDVGNSYVLSEGTAIEFSGTTATLIRLAPSYYNLVISGSNVSTSSTTGGLTFQTGGNFTVKSGGIFKVATDAGFSGGTATAIRNTNTPSITLETGSTIEYSTANTQTITNTVPYQNLILAGSASKIAPSATLAIQGNLTKSGTSTFNPNGGLVLLNGSSAQSFAGLPYSQLQLTGSTKTTSGSSSIDSLLKIDPSTTLNLSALDSIVILSTATRTASVAAIPSSAVINYLEAGAAKGKFVVERYLLNGKKWRLLSVPTNSNQTFRKSWQEDGNTVGTVGSYGFWAVDNNPNAVSRGFDGAGSNSSIKRYNPTSQSWVAVANTNSVQMNTERGYMAFVPGNRDVNSFATASTSTTLRTKGELYREGNAALQIDIPVGQQTLIGNPFASRIDLRTLNMTNVDLAFIVWDPTLTTGSTYGLGAFNTLAWNGTNYENLLASAAYGAALSENNFIQSGLAFFVRSSVTQGSITFEEINKAVGSSVTSFTAGAAQRLRANLYKAPISGNSAVLMDGVMANFSDTYSNEIDGKDIRKVKTFNENVSWKTSDSSVVIDRRAIIENKDTLHLDLSGLRVQEYQWEIISDNLDFPGRTGFLIDRYLNTSTPLNMAGTTTVNFNVANVAGSYAADRFKIVFLQEAAGPLPVTFTTVTANRNTDRSVAVQWKVEQEINIVSYEIERSNNGSNFTAVHNRTATGNNSSSVTYNYTDLTPFSGDNFYRIKATSVGGQVQYSAIVKVGSSNSNPTITVYPNPVKDKTIQVRFEQQGSGRFQLQLIATNGQTVFVKELLLNNFNQMQTLTIPNNVSAGSYQLKIQKPDGSVEITKLWIE